MSNILKLRNEYKVSPQASLLMEQGSSGMSGAQMLQTGHAQAFYPAKALSDGLKP